MIRWTLALLATLAVLGLSPPAGAAGSGSGGGLRDSPLLWVTVDVCTSSASVDVVGVRGSMPGTGNEHEQMYVRFRLQYEAAPGSWRYLGRAADSGFVHVGTALYLNRQAGLDFDLSAKTAAGTVLRGVATFQWRIGGSVTHHAQLDTTPGHAASAGAIPAGYSAARCTIT
jgi:hypothetical protein